MLINALDKPKGTLRLEDDTQEPPAFCAAKPSHTGPDTGGHSGLTKRPRPCFFVYGFDFQPQQINNEGEGSFCKDGFNTVHKRRKKAPMASNNHPMLKHKAKIRLK